MALAALLMAPAPPATAREHLPQLNAVPGSQSYEVSFVSDPYMADITFDRGARFFIVGDPRNDDVVKFDAAGQQVFRLKYATGNFRPAFSPFVAGAGGILDLSRERPRLSRFRNVLNGTRKRMTRKAFLASFSRHYAEAEIVAYGEYDSAIAKYAVYLRTAGRWAVFYVSPVTIDIDEDHDQGNAIAGFPPKYERMVLLRDPVRKVYSYGAYRLRDGKVALPEDRLKYSRAASLKRLSYSSDFVLEEVPYTPIPGSFAGIATYRLTVGGETIEFREMATRALLRARVSTNLSLFQLPRPHDREVPVLFLEFRPPNNFSTLGSDGLYIIRPRR